jgi:hypothetical protein
VSKDFSLTADERHMLVEQVIDAASTSPMTPMTPKAARMGLFFAAGVVALAGVDRETFLNAAAADFDDAKRGAL